MLTTKGQRESEVVMEWMRKVKDAEQAFLSEWTWTSLKLLDEELYSRLVEQRRDFERVCVTGEIAEVEEQGAATCRGFAYCGQCLREADRPSDLGMVQGDGFVVTARPGWKGDDPAAVVLTTDDLKEILELPSVQELLAVLRMWPGARLAGTRAQK